MNTRLARLYRSAILSFAAMAPLLMFMVPASREFIAGRPFFMVAILTGIAITAGLGLLFLAGADRVADRDSKIADAATI